MRRRFNVFKGYLKISNFVFMRSSLDKNGFVKTSKKMTLDAAYMPMNGKLEITFATYLCHKNPPSRESVVHTSIIRENAAPPAAPSRHINKRFFFFARNSSTPAINPNIPQENIWKGVQGP